MTDASVVENVLASYLDRYQERKATSKSGLPFEAWEPNVLVAEIYALLAGAADSPRIRAMCLREMDDLATTAGRGRPDEQQINALAYLWTRPAPFAASAEMPPTAVVHALAGGGTPETLAAPNAIFWRVRALPVLCRFASGSQLRDLDLELKWWSRRLLFWPALLAGEQAPEFASLAGGALLQAELAAAAGNAELAAAARASVVALADADRYPLAELLTAEIARALVAASIAGAASIADRWLEELVESRLDPKRGLLYGRATGARYEFSPWVPRGLAAAAQSLDRLFDAMARPFPGLQAGIAQ